MTTRKLGSRQVTAVLDTTGLNPGNWTASFTQQIFNANIDQYEIMHIYVTTNYGVPINWLANSAVGQFQVWVNKQPWDFQPYSSNNGWDPSQPLPLNDGDEVDFFFSNSTAPAPLVVVWLQYNDGDD